MGPVQEPVEITPLDFSARTHYYCATPKPTNMDYEYEYGYETAQLSPGMIIFFILLSVFYLVCMWKIYVKAGQPGWAAIIPIYNIYILTKIGGKPGYWTLLCLIPLVNLVFMIWLTNMLSKSFGKDEGFTIGLVILGFIFYPILAFGPAKYLGPYGDPAAFHAYQEQNRFDFEKRES